MDLQKMGPLTEHHPLVTNKTQCPACLESFQKYDYVTLITLGPGDDEEEREKAREGRAYNAVAAPVHWACATGELE